MKNSKIDIPILIVGGGPVGLFLAITLLKKGIACKVIERRIEPIPDSRSLGIHPVSLELFDELGITEPFLAKGLKIKKGFALTESKLLGKISFAECPKPHNYILACPQFTTETILREELQKLDEEALTPGAEFHSFEESDEWITTTYHQNEQEMQLKSQFLIGCDGKNSPVRREASIHYSGKRYPDTYIMGDFEDTTYFGSDAAVFLPKEGLIECFPLPNGMRRWVAKTNEYISEPNDKLLTAIVKSRINYELSGIESTMISSFGVQHFLAESFAKGRVLLAGDAAHVVSPIGGQGMNLGWLGAWNLAPKIALSIKSEGHPDLSVPAFDTYTKEQQYITKKVAQRAEINMRLGREKKLPYLRNLFISSVLRSPLKTKVAGLFTMRGLEDWWV